MLIDIELIRRPDGHYTARALRFPGFVVEAPTREAALDRMRAALLARRQAHVEVVRLELDDADAPVLPSWPRHAGAFADDATYAAMLTEVARQRLADDRHYPGDLLGEITPELAALAELDDDELW